MNTLRRSVLALVLASAPLAQGGCQEKPPEDDGARAKMATDLVQCQNEKQGLKEQIAELKSQLANATQEVVLQVPALDLKAQPPKGPKVAPAPKPDVPSIPPETLTKVIKTNQGGLRVCYEKALKRNPNIQYISLVTVRFTIRNSGLPDKIVLKPSPDKEMEHCMAQAIGHWQFPSFPGEPVQVEAPVNLVAK